MQLPSPRTHKPSAQVELEEPLATHRRRIAWDSGSTSFDYEYEYDIPFVLFIGLETRAERVNAFVRMSLVGEDLGSIWAGAAVKF